MSNKHLWQTCVALLGVIQLAHCANLILLCPSSQRNITVLLSNPCALLQSDCFNNSRLFCIYAFGFDGKVDGPATTNVTKQLNETQKCNTIILDWTLEASAITFNTSLDPYTKESSYVFSGLPEVYNVGTQLGYALWKFTKCGINPDSIHMIGHSLGAQLVAIAGRTLLKIFRILVGWIVGLDPAGPFFSNPPVLPSISADDGKAVMCIHTDPGDYGSNTTNCTADIYMNFYAFTLPDKQNRVQPGCPIGNFQKFTDDDLCSHNRAWMYYTEAMKNPCSPMNFESSKANNCSDTLAVTLIWDYIKKTGVYCSETNAQSPYNKGESGSCPEI